MNKSELESILKKARLPEDFEESPEIFPRQIAGRIARAPVQSRRVEHRWFPKLAWGLAAAICVLAVFRIDYRRARFPVEMVPPADVLASAKLIREALAMFPNRVSAIEQDERGVNLILSDNDDVPASTPIYVHVCDGSHCSSFVTFSGQEVQVAGQKVTVLSDARGGIILTGNQFLWSDAGQITANSGLKISAKNLNSVSM